MIYVHGIRPAPLSRGGLYHVHTTNGEASKDKMDRRVPDELWFLFVTKKIADCQKKG